jgi:DHA1 family multidrug resistance protein-like MFS transporter
LNERWQKTLWVVFVAQFISATGFAVMFPFLPLYIAELGSDTGLSLEFWAAAVYSGQALTMTLVSPFWGSIADRHGHKLMLLRASFGGFFVLGAMAFVTSAEQLTLLRLLQGLITGTIAAANAMVAAIAPRERLGYAMGVLQVGMATGVAVGPVLGGLLADFVGFRAALILTAVLVGGSGFVVLFATPNVKTAATDKSTASGWASWKALLNVPGVSLVYLLRFLHGTAQSIIYPVLPLFVLLLLPNSDRVSTWTGALVAGWAVASTISSIYFGKLGDRIGHRPVLIGCVLATALGFVPQAFATDIWFMLVLQIVTGFAAGGIVPALSALLGNLMPPGSAGATYGLDNSISSGSRALAPMLGAVLMTVAGPRSVFAMIGFLLLAAAVLAILRLPRQSVAVSH